ncbi:MAG: putative zinc-binding protein [Alphaproteobacteria bacterium]|nr:zinc-binding protein [Alphaproteobacteria bacterium]MDE2112229.1 putative zinc-binding protein [Alphaproteobacteria bacterium]MDE2494161.1 putative zinc-binding protein [Alphaproteobacteria bacterium]
MSEADCFCSTGPKLIFACSGASDVGEIADQTAHKLTRESASRMYCLAEIGGRVASIVKTAKTAQSILAIDGCSQSCTRHCLELAGLKDFTHLQLGGLGMDKGLSPITDDAIGRAAAAARDLLSG